MGVGVVKGGRGEEERKMMRPRAEGHPGPNRHLPKMEVEKMLIVNGSSNVLAYLSKLKAVLV